ncbi:uncharacterized protein LOC126381609 [Pectinophora gossypiella]|uniref:uncharacterized protein LOC126381609 n=1 Tax=Pectinophora gossypiella TaxID=13191 RepID=UPI00214E4A62|nr:uncharacterized protein LOC126381609 [Pectinophora gossypiella]
MDKISNRLKCSNCNIVISEVLAFIQNKIDVMTEVSLAQICESAFNAEEISEAKSLLFESLSKKMKKRIRQGKTLRNIEDIICLFKETDPEQIPIFVARNLEKLPPVTFDHVDVTALLKKIVVLEKSLQNIEQNYVSKRELKEHSIGQYKTNSLLAQEQNVNTKRRGSFINNMYDSGPMALTTSFKNVSYLDEVNEPNDCASPSRASIDKSAHSCHSSPINQTGRKETGLLPERAASGVRNIPSESGMTGECALSFTSTTGMNDAAQPPSRLTVNKTADERSDRRETIPTTGCDNEQIENSPKNELSSKNASFADIIKSDAAWKVPQRSEEWQLVQKRRLRNRLISQKGSAVTESGVNTFKAADTKIPLFISNVHKDVAEQDIINYIHEKTGEIVTLVKIKMKQERKYNAYKLFVTKYKLATFLDDKIWPTGISFRRFVRFYELRG